MKILVYGSKGWIGSQFLRILETMQNTENTQNQNLIYVEGKSRVDNEKQLIEEIEMTEPTHIVSFIGITDCP